MVLAEPADVAEVGEDRRRLGRVDEARRQLLAEQVLVADVGRDPLAARRRTTAPRSGPRLKSPSGMFIISREPAEAGRDELAERHQVVLVVAVEAARQAGGRGRDADRRVGVAARLVAERQAEQRRPPGLAEAARAAPARSRVELLGQQRDHRLRADDQVAACRLQLRDGRRPAPRGTWRAANFSSCGTLPCSSDTDSVPGRPGEVDAAGDGAQRERRQQQPGRRDPGPGRAASVATAECRRQRGGDRARCRRRRPRARSRPSGESTCA